MDLLNFNMDLGTTETIKGADGKSAYQIAVDEGFAGTQTEWLASLKGADGLDGRDGLNGADGQNGRDGIDGINGTNGTNGKSAYELAVEHGFIGTEEQWLESLKATYDDTEIKSRVTTLESTIGSLNDSLEAVLDGGN